MGFGRRHLHVLGVELVSCWRFDIPCTGKRCKVKELHCGGGGSLLKVRDAAPPLESGISKARAEPKNVWLSQPIRRPTAAKQEKKW